MKVWPLRREKAHKLVDAHFEGGLSARQSARMWRHLETCDVCRKRYNAHALLEAMDAAGELHARRRLEPPALTSGRQAAPKRVWGFGIAAALGTVCLLLLWVRPNPSAFSVRGGTPPAEPGAHANLQLFRVARTQQDASAVQVHARIGDYLRHGEGLAFSYQNQDKPPYSRLMVFAVDADGQVFWFWPAWQAAHEDPHGVAISSSSGLTELGEAVFHQHRPGALTVYGLFSHAPVSVKEVEVILAETGPRGLQQNGNHLWSQELEVRP